MHTMKRLFTKCKASGDSEYLVILDWRNTPTERIGTSPAQRLMGRRCRTLLPVVDTLLQPRYFTAEATRALRGMKQRQQHYYNKGSKPLQPISPGKTVRMEFPGQTTWSAGTCMGDVAPRSYNVKVEGSTYRRNRRHLFYSGATAIPDVTTNISQDESPAPSEDAPAAPSETPTPRYPVSSGPRRSLRNHRHPTWLSD